MNKQTSKVPKILFKYRKFDSKNLHVQTILENEFYFSSRKEFNDPFDMTFRPYYEYGATEDMLKYHQNAIYNEWNWLTEKEKIEFWKDAKERILRNPTELTRKQIENFEKEMDIRGVLSLSTVWNDVLMWSHYSDSNKGFCVGLNSSILKNFITNQRKNEYVIMPVIYSDTPPKIKPYIDGFTDFGVMTFFCLKYKKWKYESEFRIVGKNKNSTSVKFPEDIISEIYIGLKCSEENKKIILQALKLKKKNIKLFRIIQIPDTFKFGREEIKY